MYEAGEEECNGEEQYLSVHCSRPNGWTITPPPTHTPSLRLHTSPGCKALLHRLPPPPVGSPHWRKQMPQALSPGHRARPATPPCIVGSRPGHSPGCKPLSQPLLYHGASNLHIQGGHPSPNLMPLPEVLSPSLGHLNRLIAEGTRTCSNSRRQGHGPTRGDRGAGEKGGGKE